MVNSVNARYVLKNFRINIIQLTHFRSNVKVLWYAVSLLYYLKSDLLFS